MQQIGMGLWGMTQVGCSSYSRTRRVLAVWLYTAVSCQLILVMILTGRMRHSPYCVPD